MTNISLWGLDVLIDNTGKYHINEFNGIDSGMNGFRQIYGDNRVEDEIYKRLVKDYGEIRVNDGTYAKNKLKSEHPLLYLKELIIKNIPDSIKLSTAFTKRLLLPKPLYSGKANTDWIKDKKISFGNPLSSRFKPYDGQPSTVFNKINELVPHPLINDYVAQELSNNKFLYYFVMKDSNLKELTPKSVLVGLGATDEKGLEELLGKSDEFVIKPIIGFCGKGVKFLSKKETEKYRNTQGMVYDSTYFDIFLNYLGFGKKIQYFEDLVAEGEFSFEKGLSIIQPFINSRKIVNGREVYSVVRAVVYNGEFIDAYMRISQNKRVNLSQDALAVPFKKKNFDEFCEKIIFNFEKESQKYDPLTMKKFLYNKYIEEAGLRRK